MLLSDIERKKMPI